jgi:hypothetical protein
MSMLVVEYQTCGTGTKSETLIGLEVRILTHPIPCVWGHHGSWCKRAKVTSLAVSRHQPMQDHKSDTDLVRNGW